jgi:hypothetical protein
MSTAEFLRLNASRANVRKVHSLVVVHRKVVAEIAVEARHLARAHAGLEGSALKPTGVSFRPPSEGGPLLPFAAPPRSAGLQGGLSTRAGY